MGNKNNKNFNIGNLTKMLGNFWNRSYKSFFIIVCLIFFVVGAYVWYESLYQSAWNDQEKEAYRSTKDSGINFKEDDFYSALKIIFERKNIYLQQKSELKDIFKKY